ncbi:Hydantoinase/oxoprolinase-domain-containing protein [Aspergillus aurantiobrunneus]
MQDIFQRSPYTLYLTQNDGSVLSAEEAVDKPIRTFNSGPTNSIRGGEFLWRAAGKASGHEQEDRTEPLVVIDIGGTTSDSGLLLPNGLPQMSSITGLVGGVRTNFALPAVESIGLGGGSVIREVDGEFTVGPDSGALELLRKAMLFGGEYLTSTDIVAASGIHTPNESNPFRGMGDPSRLAGVTPEIVSRARKVMSPMIAGLVDRTKTQKGDVDVLIVGGGAPIIKTDGSLTGIRNLRTVKGAEVANAVGAAISRVSSVIDTVVDTSNQTIKEAQGTVSLLAVEKAATNGAKPDTVQIAEVTMLPIQYVDAKARIVVRAVGGLAVVAQAAAAVKLDTFEDEPPQNQGKTIQVISSLDAINIQTYRPIIENQQWVISPIDLKFIAQGCKVLGCGGGGDPYQEYLKLAGQDAWAVPK